MYMYMYVYIYIYIYIYMRTVFARVSCARRAVEGNLVFSWFVVPSVSFFCVFWVLSLESSVQFVSLRWGPSLSSLLLFVCLCSRSCRGLPPHIKLHSLSGGGWSFLCGSPCFVLAVVVPLSCLCCLFFVSAVVFLSSVVFPQWILDLWCCYLRSRLCVLMIMLFWSVSSLFRLSLF